jgi:broad specificity phosphatase PhoE
MKVYLLRHGEGVHNADRILPDNIEGSKYNDMTLELTSKGQGQAEEASKVVEGLGITHTFTSDMRRASQTAEIATKNLDVEIQHDQRLREFGNGKKSDVAGIPYSQTPKDFLDDPGKYGAENYEEMYNRSRSFTNDLDQIDDENANVLLVGHGGQQCMIIYCLGEDPEKPFDEKLFKEKYFVERSNTSIAMMDMEYKPEYKHLRGPKMVHGVEGEKIASINNVKH